MQRSRKLRLHRALFLVLAGPGMLNSAAAEEATPTPEPSATQPSHWCAPELQALNESACFFSPSQDAGAQKTNSNTLVIFLHSLIGAAPEAAWEQQRRMVLNAKAYGFSALVPRGRPALGPRRDPRVLAWPTSQELQKEYEAELLGEWQSAKAQAEAINGPFDRVLLFGFSNGAYYASSIVFRERFTVDGVALFAGGSGSKYQRILANRAKHRTPIFLGYGTQDPDHKRQEDLVRLLRQLSWPHRSLASRVGHTVSDAQIRGALSFFGHGKTPNAEE